MAPYQQRVVDEKADLDSRIASLEIFQETQVFGAIDSCDRALLNRQHELMCKLSHVLKDRIERF